MPCPAAHREGTATSLLPDHPTRGTPARNRLPCVHLHRGGGTGANRCCPPPSPPPKQHHHRDTAPTNRTLHLSKSLSGCAPFKLTPPGVSFFFFFPVCLVFLNYFFELFLFHFIFSILERRGSHRAAAFPSAGRRGCSGTARLGGTGAKEPTGLL